MSFRRGRIRGSFRFARDSFQINAISVPLCAISWDYSRSNICNARSIFVLTRNQSFNNGYYPAFQAGDEGSTPFTRSKIAKPLG